MILHLSEITKGRRQDVVLDYTLNLKYSNYLLSLFIYLFFILKRGYLWTHHPLSLFVTKE